MKLKLLLLKVKKIKAVKTLLFCAVFLLGFFTATMQTAAWSNGGYSDDPTDPDYGTHDWLAEHALDWLPANEKEFITNNLAVFLYGTELPDNPNPEDGIGDTTKHHVYFNSTEALIDDSSAVRAQEEYNKVLSFLETNDFVNAAKTAGIMSHYIADLAVFGHVMGSSTDWGSEIHHSDYESYVNTRTDSYSDSFTTYLSFDGNLENISAYDAAINLAYDTTFDVDGNLTCTWMDSNYDWNNLTFKDRCGRSLNFAVNSLTDVLHTLAFFSHQVNEDGTLKVHVYTEATNGAITGAMVSVYFYINGTLAAEATTNTAGDAQFTLREEDYYLTVHCEGYEDYDHILFLNQDLESQVPMIQSEPVVTGVDPLIVGVIGILVISLVAILFIRRRG